jgi:hypothetical protein
MMITNTTTTEDTMNKTFIAHYRYREEGRIGPIDYSVELAAPSIKEAKRVAKGWEGRDDRMTWFMGLEKKETK